LPLHVSLSRPLSLTTRQKDTFLSRVTDAVAASSIHPFALNPHGLGWYHSPDSARTFLILRVSHGTTHAPPDVEGAGAGVLVPANRELGRLLGRFNTVAAALGQPPLYQRRASRAVQEAFHVSIAWCFSLPAEEICLQTHELLRREPHGEICKWKIPVQVVKAKIGNVVTQIPLPEKGRVADRRSADANSMFED
jgi:U6 snRNA phosphodiesterase